MNRLSYPIITLTSSFCTMCYSMLMASIMMDFTGEEVMTQCMSMGPYLLGLGFGSGMGDKIKLDRQLVVLWRLEWLSVIILPIIPLLQVLGVFLFINLSPPGITLESRSALQVLLGLTAVLSFISGILGGAQLPLILKLEKKIPEAWVLAINYLGPLLAGLAIVRFNQMIIPVSIQLFMVGLVQILGLVLLMSHFPNLMRSLLSLFIPLFLLIAVGHIYPELEALTVKSSYMGTKSSLEKLKNPGSLINTLRKYGSVERLKTPYQTIDLFIEPPSLEYSIPGNASVYLNRKPQFDLFSSAIYHQTMVYSGINLLKTLPNNVLILGAGDGLLLKEFKAFPMIDKITMVELDEMMLEWSRTNNVVSQLNQGALDSIPANIDLQVGDGVSFLRNNGGKILYDLILIDFPFPNGHELAKLYSYEFYRLVKRSLAPGGVVIIDLPLYFDLENKLSHESKVIIKTMKASGFENPMLFGPSGSFVALSADGKKMSFDYQKFPQHSLSVATYFNFLEAFREEEITPAEWAKIEVNTMFWPKGL